MTTADQTASRGSGAAAAFRREVLPPFLVMIGALALWELLVLILQPPPFILPSPSAIFGALTANLSDLFLYGFNTFRQAFSGFLIGCTAGIIGAMIVAQSDTLSAVVLPFAVASNSIPIVAMAPLAIVWFGIDEGSKIAIVAVMCFFPTLVSTVRGLNSASPDALALMRSYAAGEREIFTKVRVPTSLPYLFNALRVCSTLSMIGAIVAEFFGGTVKFLGVYIKTEANILHTTNAWAAIVVACIYGLAFYLAIVGLERVAMPWYREER